MSPLIPLLLLLAGALALLLGLLPRFRHTGPIAVAAALAALATLLWMALGLPVSATLSNWLPAELFRTGLALNVDGLAWLFALAVLAATIAALVTGLARPGGRRVGNRVAILLLTLTALMSIFSENVLTRVVAWALLDIIYFLSLLWLAEGESLEPQAVLNLTFNAAGTLCAVAAAVLISRTSATLSLRDAALTPQSTVLMTLAAIFRLGLFPLHLALPTEVTLRQGVGTLIRLIPAAVALETLSRLALFGFSETVRPWLAVFALAALVVGAFQLWNSADPRHGLIYLVIAQSGVAVLAGLWGGAQGALALTVTTLTLIMGGALIYLSSGHDEQRPWPTALPLVGVAAIGGLPLTVGFLGVGHLYASLIAAGGWYWLALAVIVLAQSVLVAGLLYAVFWPGVSLEAEPVTFAAYFGGLSLPAMLLVLTAIFATLPGSIALMQDLGLLGFSGLGSAVAALLVVISLAAGYALWRFDALIRGFAAPLTGLSLANITRLDWLYALVWNVLRSLGSLVDNVGAILEGEGAILWALVVGVLAWLLTRQ
ncbi:MAG: hypothetical protein ABI847_04160 [Anaerolineales bacterium]